MYEYAPPSQCYVKLRKYARARRAKNTETPGSSHEGVMILPVLTVSTLPYQTYGQTDVRTNRASHGDRPKLDALTI